MLVKGKSQNLCMEEKGFSSNWKEDERSSRRFVIRGVFTKVLCYLSVCVYIYIYIYIYIGSDKEGRAKEWEQEKKKEVGGQCQS